MSQEDNIQPCDDSFSEWLQETLGKGQKKLTPEEQQRARDSGEEVVNSADMELVTEGLKHFKLNKGR